MASDEPLADIRIGAVYSPTGRVPKVQSAHDELWARRRVVLVHGFNSSPESSAKGYDAFRAEIRAVAPKLDRDIKTLTWPGRALYWNAVGRASGQIADKLAEFLDRSARRLPYQLVFVAHSLGCRLVLETLHRLSPAARADILPRTRLFLMAPAVPTRTVADGGHLRATVAGCLRTEIFYSFTDEALGLAFTMGQLREGGVTQAVGFAGQPAELWGARRHNMTPYRHGSYWKSEHIAYRIALTLRAAEFRPLSRQRMKQRAWASRTISHRGLDRREMESRSL